LPLEASQFIIDQLLVRKKNRLDIYCLFAITVLVLSDDLEPTFKKGGSLKDFLE
jgi:hypothetical protein